ncbi:zinc finger protein interacting with ribonucleoprotein K-like isoform X1 [Lucilia sericata]|uniref:zinc finger protein interacting with ribonucleoprotein K-like isoform X1 n=1 Tax=Lucilia sericata TaxID=13632 RepID=UPI0018A85614|nr:zinc finger protein interacting with ribonucleoprotein K-like isoform X1 [Lucilia sericata]
MILCGNVFLDELKDTFILCCVLCKKKSRRYNDFTSHVKAKHKELNEKGAAPSRQIVRKIKDEDDSDDDEDECQDENEEQKPDVEVKDEMDVDPHEEFIDDIKYDVQEIEPFIDPILALEEKESADATDVLDALDSDVKDEDYMADELDNDDSDDEDYRDEDNDNAADSESDDNELPISTDKFTPTFYRKKRHVNDFIELYKSQPVLWDINDPLFENPKAQKEAEQAIINGMQKFNIFLKPTGLKSAINQIHKYCVIIKSDLDNGDTKKVTSIAKGYYEKCDFLKDLLAKKAIPEGDKQNELNKKQERNKNREQNQNLLNFKKLDGNTLMFIDTYEKFPQLYDGNHPLYENVEEKLKSLTEFADQLLLYNGLNFSIQNLSIAIRQLQSWYYHSKTRNENQKKKLNDHEMEYFRKCSFFPPKRLIDKYFCTICKQQFTLKSSLDGHLFRHHQIGDLSFECDKCGRKYAQKNILREHVQRMHGSKEFSCGFCGKLFAIKSELKVHTMVHTAEKPHVCELCGKAFRIKTQLRYHVTAIHTKIRAYKCTMCPKDFLKKRDLTDHIKTHLNIRDKVCETCGKGFSNNHSLIRHRQIHSEVKRYACKLCDAKYHQFVGLNSHMKRTHNIVKKDSFSNEISL